jgi:shikimate dehydrogenase
MITSHTGLCGLIGEPVTHSLSPVMQNAAFEAMGLDFVYLAFAVDGRNVDLALAGCRALGLRGFNVTVPYKEAVLPFLDDVDPEASRIGAVNTVVNKSGRLYGHNTDSRGFKRSLSDFGFEPAGRNVIILGAGGVARAIAFSLIEEVAGLTITTRKESLEKGHLLADELGPKASARDLSELEQLLDGASLLVNATSAGMIPHVDETLVSQEFLRSGLTVFDAVYNPQETRLLREAVASGSSVISGVDMLVNQGELRFEIWTGKAPPDGVMKAAVKKALEGNSPGSIEKIILIGFMGSGKSAVGKLLARRLGRPLLDTDLMVEQKTRRTINEIFSNGNERVFRELESEAVAEASLVPDAIISCGGGAVLDPASAARLKQNSFVVYLRCAPRVLLSRLANGRNRPLLGEEGRLETINGLLSERSPVYEKLADCTIETSNMGLEAVVEAILRENLRRDSKSHVRRLKEDLK